MIRTDTSKFADVRVFVQARMSSSRYPGKMLAPFRGRPLIDHVIGQFDGSPLRSRIVVLTSVDRTDDPLADFVANRCATPVFRGVLDDVLSRFQAALEEHPCGWCVRISGDSPLIDAGLVMRMLDFVGDDWDVVSNVVQRTFPPGQSIECLNAASLCGLAPSDLSPDEREHVTKVFYAAPRRWKIRSVVSREPSWAGRRMVVDTLEDLRILEGGIEVPRSFADLACVEAGSA